jgi:hypothetical protein
VFEVLRKEFKYCTFSVPGHDVEVTSTNMQILESILLNTTSKFTIVKTKEQIEKQKEKEAYFANEKPVKMKKPQLTGLGIVLDSSKPNQTNLSQPHESKITIGSESTTTNTDAPPPESTTNAVPYGRIEPNEISEQSTTENIIVSTEESVASEVPSKVTQDESVEDSIEAIRFNRIEPFHFKSPWAETAEDNGRNKDKSSKWPFQSKVKATPKQQRPLKFGFSNSSPVLSKNALKLARIQRRLEKRI